MEQPFLGSPVFKQQLPAPVRKIDLLRAYQMLLFMLLIPMYLSLLSAMLAVSLVTIV